MHNIPYHKQETIYTCGAACMRMVLEALGIKKTEKQITKLLGTNKISGTRSAKFPIVAEKYKLDYRIERGNTKINDLRRAYKKGFLIIVNFVLPSMGGHYAVVTKIGREYIYLHDPWVGANTKYPIITFKSIWNGGRPGTRGSDNEQFWFFGVRK